MLRLDPFISFEEEAELELRQGKGKEVNNVKKLMDELNK